MVENRSSNDAQQTEGAARRVSRFRNGSICILCLGFSLPVVFLLLSIIFVVLEVPLGFQSLTFRNLIVEVFYAAVVPTIGFTSEIIRSLFPWPILVILALLLVAWGPDRVKEILSSAKFELPGGIKFEGGATAPDAFKKEMGDAQKIVTKTNKEIEEAYSAAKTYVVQLRDAYQVDKLVADLAARIAVVIGPQCPDDYRLTVYVPDLVFSDRLYQLVEYYDNRGRRITEGRFGRAFSIRYGIIGRVWRSGVAEVEGELISTEDRAQIGDSNDVRELERFIARRWGLTLDEAVRVRPYQSYGAMRIDRGDKPLGVVFFDSKKKNAFGDSDIAKKINDAVQDSDLAISLLEISREIANWSRIQIFRNP
jgi:hypothetical protein